MANDVEKLLNQRINPGEFEKVCQKQFYKMFKCDNTEVPEEHCEQTITEHVLTGNGNKDPGKNGKDHQPRLDFFSIIGKKGTDNHSVRGIPSNQKDLNIILNLEFSTNKGSALKQKTFVEKTIYATKFVDAHHTVGRGTTIIDTVKRFRQQKPSKLKPHDKKVKASDYDELNADEKKIRYYLIVISHEKEKKLKKGDFQDSLNKEAKKHGLNDSFDVKNIKVQDEKRHWRKKEGGYLVITPNKEKIFVGQLTRSETVDLFLTIKEIDIDNLPSGRRKALFERFLWTLTASALGISDEDAVDCGAVCSTDTASHRGKISPLDGYADLGPSPFEIDGNKILAQVHQFKLKQSELVRMISVPRTIQGPSQLQRPVYSPHLKGMAQAIDKNKRFPLPIVVSMDGQSRIKLDGGGQSVQSERCPYTIVCPYGWEVTDGQHRIFSYYYTTGTKDIEIDVHAYEFPTNTNPKDIRKAMGEVFFDINHRGLPPAKEPAMEYYARLVRHSKNPWTFRTKFRDVQGEKQIHSSRLHAMRFLMELNKLSMFQDVFNLTGVRGSEGYPINSILTNSTDYFEFAIDTDGEPRTSKSIQEKYQQTDKKGKSIAPTSTKRAVFPDKTTWKGFTKGPTNYAGPMPYDLVQTGFYELLTKDFVRFCQNIGLTKNPKNKTETLSSAKCIREWIKNAGQSFFAGLLDFFVHYHCIGNPPKGGGKDLYNGLNISSPDLEKVGPLLEDVHFQVTSGKENTEFGGLGPLTGSNSSFLKSGKGRQQWFRMLVHAYNHDATTALNHENWDNDDTETMIRDGKKE